MALSPDGIHDDRVLDVCSMAFCVFSVTLERTFLAFSWGVVALSGGGIIAKVGVSVVLTLPAATAGGTVGSEFIIRAILKESSSSKHW